jgi:SH3-like domain-containing protein
MVRTRIFTQIALFLHVLAGGLIAAAPQFPQPYIVDEEDVLVRSGPGDDYYATSFVAKGEVVEVLRIDHERWAAIAPPRGSFNWIEARVLEPSSLSDVRKVREERVRTRVGSRFTKDREVAYVTLQRGDHVRLLEPTPADASDTDWVKIAPSKGELRWIPLEALSPTDGRDKPSPDAQYSQVAAAMVEGKEANEEKVSDEAEATVAPSDRKFAEKTHDEASDEAMVGGREDDPATEDPTQDPDSCESVCAESDVIEPIPTGRDEDTDPSKVVRAQWSYDLAPRTYDDKASRQARKETEKDLQSPPERALTLSQAFGELRQAVNAIQEETVHEATPNRVPMEDGALADPANEGWVRPASGDDADEALAPAENLLPPSSPNGPPPPSNPEGGTNQALDGSSVGSNAVPGEAAFQESLRIGAELARVIANADPSTWNLTPLRSRAEAVVDTAGSAEVRKSGQDLIARIAQFEDIQRRHRQLIAAKTPRPVEGTEGNQDEVGFLRRFGNRTLAKGNDRLPNAPVDTSRYDGYGWLMPVATNRENVPKYVLTDNEGNILQFVTPRAGMNLQRYERQRVGIYGERGYLPDVNQPILTADRIISMDRVR